ncbi:MAG TPA: hypothetical protein VFV50_17855 [Bdellovibrionales bacterium]|nr:hypothetical protein [Bdellovibrionales bacterium]
MQRQILAVLPLLILAVLVGRKCATDAQDGPQSLEPEFREIEELSWCRGSIKEFAGSDGTRIKWTGNRYKANAPSGATRDVTDAFTAWQREHCTIPVDRNLRHSETDISEQEGRAIFIFTDDSEARFTKLRGGAFMYIPYIFTSSSFDSGWSRLHGPDFK